jgi:hypothetical protein
MNSNFFLSPTLGCVMWPELFRKILETVPKLREPVDSHRVRIVLALVLKLNYARVRSVPKPRESLGRYERGIFPALGLELSSLLRNMSQFPLVKTWGAARGGLNHV